MTPTRASTSPAWLVRLVAELDAADQRAEALVKPLSLEQLNWPPRHGAWSIGQCIQHLCITNEIHIQPVVDALRATPTGPVQKITPGWFARYFIANYIAPSDTPKKARAPKKIAPQERVELSVLDRFVRSNVAMRELAESAKDHDVNRIRFKDPLVPVKLFTVGTGFEIIWKHQQRHLLQAEKVRAEKGFPAR